MSPAPPRQVDAGLPPASGQAAIVLGFLLGTWMLLNGVLHWITGQYVALPHWAQSWSFGSAGLVFVFGLLWMLVPNLYLFQNRWRSWQATVVLVVVSSWSLGLVTPILVAQLILLLLPQTRRGLLP